MAAVEITTNDAVNADLAGGDKYKLVETIVSTKDITNSELNGALTPDTLVADEEASAAADAADAADTEQVHEYDLVIVGAGISGINMAYRAQTQLRATSYVVLEAREAMGGTWDLMRYPGVRSDSDLHTFGFAWRPWTEKNPIAEGGLIVKYLKESAAETGVDRNILYRHKLKEARWQSREQAWTLSVEAADAEGSVSRKRFRAKWIVLGTGYYDYDTPLESQIPGLEKFKGKVLHPQFWPADLDYAGKKVAVIGSGATAVTIIPAMAEKAEKVTMVQRSPSYVIAIPNRIAPRKWWERMLPEWMQHRITRLRYLVGGFFYRRFLSDGEKTRAFLARITQMQLPPNIPYDPHFKPSYLPWAQRMCLCPDGDFFKALRSGKADVATGVIKTVTEDSVELESGQKIDADIIVTATGLKMKYGGNAKYFVDGEAIKWSDKYMWRGVMIQDMPNLAIVQGYTKASWTLGADATAHMVVRMIKHLHWNGYTSGTPRIPNKDMVKLTSANGVMGLTSTYILRALHRLPRTSDEGPWKPRGNYLKDMFDAKFSSVKAGMQFVEATKQA